MSADAKRPDLTCRECRGNLLWDAAAQKLRCKGCGALSQVSGAGRIVEHDLEQALTERLVRGRIGSGSRQVRCRECQAEVEVPDEISATRCEFCGSALLLVEEAAEDHYLPESMIPFSIDRAQAVRAFQSWLGGLWLRPANLRRAASLHELHGVYIPYWAFGCTAISRYSADAGYTYWVEQRVPGPPEGEVRRVARTRWEPCSGQRHDRHENHLVCASRGLPSELRGAHRFELAGLLPYTAEYLLGFAAERYAVDLQAAWQRARGEIESIQDQRCAADVPGDTHRALSTTHQIERVRFKHVLLPMWIATYRYRGRLHRFLVNGQSGQVVGTAPYSPWKLALVSVLFVSLVAALFYLVHRSRPEPLGSGPGFDSRSECWFDSPRCAKPAARRLLLDPVQ